MAAPYLLLLLWVLPLYLLHGPQQSLMAFDEVHYAGRAKLMVDSGNWINPWLAPPSQNSGLLLARGALFSSLWRQ
jgi:hypothetical protein